MSKSMKKTSGFGSVLFGIAMIVNPNINVIDVLPDFIGYIFIIRALTRAADSAPHFQEAKTMFVRLLWLSVLRFPASLIINVAREGNYSDNDIIVLMTLVFTVAECILLILAVSHLFSALFYLGERTDAAQLIEPFNYRNDKMMRPEVLRNICYIYAAIKCSLNLIPEAFLLTKTVEIGSNEYVQHMSKYYPISLLIAIPVSLTFGIIFYKLVKRYLTSVGREQISAAIDAIAMESPGIAENKRKLRRTKIGVIGIAMASLFSVELIFDNFKEINLIPGFVFGSIMAIGAVFMAECADSARLKICAAALGVIHFISSIVSYTVLIDFLSKHSYRDLVLGSVAKKAYLAVIISSAIELAVVLGLLTVGALINRAFILKNTGLSPRSERYNSHDKDYHISLIYRGYLMFALGALTCTVKFINTLLKYNAQLIFTEPGDITAPSIAASSAPWFTVVVFAVTVIYIIYSLIYLETVKEEVDLKYQIY